jgi:hypothetical protein
MVPTPTLEHVDFVYLHHGNTMLYVGSVYIFLFNVVLSNLITSYGNLARNTQFSHQTLFFFVFYMDLP